MKLSDLGGMVITSIKPRNDGAIVLICRNFPGLVEKEVMLVFRAECINGSKETRVLCEVEIETEKIVKVKTYEEVTV